MVKLHGGELSSFSAGEGCGSTFTLALPAVSVVASGAGAGAGAGGAEEVSQCSLDLLKAGGDMEQNRAYRVLQATSDSEGGGDSGQTPALPDPGEEWRHAGIRRVMVVDDSLPSRKMLCRLLKNGGYLCSQAENGQECVEMMVQNRDDPIRAATPTEGGRGEAGGGCCDSDLIQAVFMDFEMPIMKGPDAARALRKLGFTCPIIGVTGNVLPADRDYFVASGADEVLTKPLYLEDLHACVQRLSLARDRDRVQRTSPRSPMSVVSRPGSGSLGLGATGPGPGAVALMGTRDVEEFL
jgi:CheY-like chemotaxis protein